MPIRMPSFTDLSDEQTAVLDDIPPRGTSLITGPPGTGKTVIAMYRAKALAEKSDGHKTTMITHSKVLAEHSKTWNDDRFNDKVDVRTYHSFIYQSIWRKVKRRESPRWPPDLPGGSEFDKDWSLITKEIMESGKELPLGHVLVDEGQDLPETFYEHMAMYVFNGWAASFSVFADENQRLDPKSNCTIDQIRSALSKLTPPVERPLTKNYRNSLPIARVAAMFFVGAATERPEFPGNRPGNPPEMLLCPNVGDMAQKIAIHAANDKSRSILVICGTQPQAKSMRNRIESQLRHAGQNHAVTWYKRNHSQHGDPAALRAGDDGVISVVHTSSMKGLEADTVFIAGIEHFDKGDSGVDVESMNLYVATSRPRSHLEIQWSDPTARLVADVAFRAREFLSRPSVEAFDQHGI